VLGPAPGVEVEVATFRSDGRYLDGRRPVDVRFGTPKEDAARRDFTINGMFLDPQTNEVLDFVGGQVDLRRGLVRAIGDPGARFEEDKLRLIRAVRFSARFGFVIEPATYEALITMAQSIRVVAPERIAQELRRILTDHHRATAMKLMHATRLLDTILPELGPVSGDPARWEHTLRMLDQLVSLPPPSFALSFAALVHALGEPPSGASSMLTDRGAATAASRLASSLRLSNADRDRIAWLVEHQHAVRALDALSIPARKRLLAHPACPDLMALFRAEVAAEGSGQERLDRAEGYLATLPEGPLDPPPLLDGSDLKQLGIAPGPIFKQILDEARDRQLEGGLRSRQEALEWLAERAPPR
jgi:poly(A) polymerase